MKYYARLTNPNNGMPIDKKNIKLLDDKVYYMVEELEIGYYISHCKLKSAIGRYGSQWFNISQFSFYDNELRQVDILRTELNKKGYELYD